MLERESSKLTNGARSVSLSVSGSFQDDNLCSSQFPALRSGFCGVFFMTQLSSHILTYTSLSVPSSPSFCSSPSSLQPDSGSGPLLLAGYENGSLLLWDVTQRSKLSQVKAHPEPVMCMTFDTTSLRGVSGSSEKTLSSWRLDGQSNLQVSRGQSV